MIMQATLRHPYMILAEIVATFALGATAHPQGLKNHTSERATFPTDSSLSSSLDTRSHLTSRDLGKVYASSEYVTAYIDAKRDYMAAEPVDNWTDVRYNPHHQHDWFVETERRILTLSDDIKLLTVKLDGFAQSSSIQNDPKKLAQRDLIKYLSTKEMMETLNSLVQNLDLAPYFKKHKSTYYLVDKNGREQVPWAIRPVPTSFDTLNPDADEVGPIRDFLFHINGRLAAASEFKAGKNYDIGYFDKLDLAKYDSKPITCAEQRFIFQQPEANTINQKLAALDRSVQKAFDMLDKYGFPTSDRKLPQYIVYGTNNRGQLAVLSVQGQKIQAQPHQ